jgi:hypothetical protein
MPAAAAPDATAPPGSQARDGSQETAAQVLPAVPGALLGIPLGIELFETA